MLRAHATISYSSCRRRKGGGEGGGGRDRSNYAELAACEFMRVLIPMCGYVCVCECKFHHD